MFVEPPSIEHYSVSNSLFWLMLFAMDVSGWPRTLNNTSQYVSLHQNSKGKRRLV